VNAFTISRTQIHQLKTALSDFEELACRHELTREFLKALKLPMSMPPQPLFARAG